jgi:hypothetical protein
VKPASSEFYPSLLEVFSPSGKRSGYPDVKPDAVILSVMKAVVFATFASPHENQINLITI